MKPYSEKFKKQRKFLTVLPLLILPFVTMVFWALGGGQGTKHTTENYQKGFNTELPTVQLPTGSLDKMSLYAQAEQDSQTLQEARAQDPYAGYTDTMANGQGIDTSIREDNFNASSYPGIQDLPDPNVLEVQKKLDELEKTLNYSSPDTNTVSAGMETEQTDNKDMEALASPLSQMMPEVPGGNQPDPELKQLDGMLEKILDIEHPERVSEQLKAQSEKEAGRVFPVTSAANTGNASLLERPFIPHLPDDSSLSIASDFQQNTFYDLSRPVTQESISHQAIAAVIDETQTLISGATVKLRLTQDVYINGLLVPKNTFVFGMGEVSGERLKIQVKDIRYGNNIFPVSLSVYDMDGIEGIKVPGAITRDAAKEGADQAIQSLQLMDMNPSLASRAAGAGIETIKGLLGKKAKLVRVTVKAGYPVLLVDQKTLK